VLSAKVSVPWPVHIRMMLLSSLSSTAKKGKTSGCSISVTVVGVKSLDMMFPYYKITSTASNEMPYVDALFIDHEVMFVASLKTPLGAVVPSPKNTVSAVV
jgi:hypothetical protein